MRYSLLLVSLVAAPLLAEELSLPDIESVFDPATQYVAGETGSTTAIESLRETGSERLYTPGRNAVDAAYGKEDPTSAAVVIVDRGAASTGTSEADPTGAIESARKAVVDAAVLPDSADIQSPVGGCKRYQQSVSGVSTTETCDIRRVTDGTSGSVTESTCTRAFYILKQTVSDWFCSITSLKEWVTEVVVPIIAKTRHNAIYRCEEGMKEGHDESCRVTRTETKATMLKAICRRPRYQAVEERCVKRLIVRAKASCTYGAQTSSEVSDPAYLGEDSIPGFDTLRVSNTCSDVSPDRIVIASNTATGGSLDWEIATAEKTFDIVKTVGSNMVRVSGNRTENEGTAVVDITMKVFAGTGTSAVLSGNLHLNFTYKPFRLSEETETWNEEGCEAI